MYIVEYILSTGVEAEMFEYKEFVAKGGLDEELES